MKIEEIKGLEEYLTQFPVFEYQVIESKELFFEPRVRVICQQECERFGTTWACPPGVGTLEECERRCLAYPYGFFFSSVAEVRDVLDMQELLATRDAHEALTGEIGAYIQRQGYDCYILSTESCDICDTCAYPEEPCRFPDRMHPCLESHGVVVSDLVERHQMTYSLGGNTVLWFSLILFREA